MVTYLSFDTCADRVRSLLGADPSRAAFLELCALVEQAAKFSLSRTIEELIPTCRSIIEQWPAKLRMAPLLWINRLIVGALPLEALHLCSALSLTAALHADLDHERNHTLLTWLAALPPDAPTLEGVTISCNRELRQRHFDEEDREPDKRFHRIERNRAGRRDGWIVDLTYLLTCSPKNQDFTLLLRSPLCRAVRVLDLSIDPVEEDLRSALQTDLTGCGLRLLDVTSLAPTASLEVLNLHGQCFDSRWQLGDPRAIARRGWASPQLPTKLLALNLGGGHPIGDGALRPLPLLCPDLHELSIVPGEAQRIFAGDNRNATFAADDWALAGDIDNMLVTSAGIAALHELRSLERLDVMRVEKHDDDDDDVYRDSLREALAAMSRVDGATLSEKIDVTHRDLYGRGHQLRDGDIAAWSAHFQA